MTDNEIIKALERLHKRILQSKCAEEITETEIMGLVNALDLINRQKAEIERLQESGKEAVSCFTRMESLYKIKCKELEVAKSEAIKEFIDELKNRVANKYEYTDIRVFKEINNLVKEMTEVSE